MISKRSFEINKRPYFFLRSYYVWLSFGFGINISFDKIFHLIYIHIQIIGWQIFIYFGNKNTKEN